MTETRKVNMPNAEQTRKAAAPSNMPSARASGTATVSVALKSPNGLVLRTFEMKEQTETTPMGRQTVKKSFPKVTPDGMPLEVTLNGTRGFRPTGEVETVGGYALTHGVPEEIWDEWLSHNEASDVVRNGLIFANRSPEAVRAEARNRRGERANTEPLRVNYGKPGEKTDPRLDKKVTTFDPKEEEVA